MTIEQCGLALSDPDAERRQAVAAPAPAELVQERDDESRTAHPERVPDRDRTAVHVDLLLVEAEVAAHRQALRGKRLVELDEVEIHVTCPDGRCDDALLHWAENLVMQVGDAFVPIKHEGVIYIRPPVG